MQMLHDLFRRSNTVGSVVDQFCSFSISLKEITIPQAPYRADDFGQTLNSALISGSSNCAHESEYCRVVI